MIYESRYWKEPLLRAATWLEKLRARDETIDASLARVEREIFIGFYAIRKLLDTFKVSTSTRKMTFGLLWSPCLGQIDYMNSHRIDELFDLGKSLTETRDIGFLCHQFVHSYVFLTVLGVEGELTGFYVSSDHSRSKKLYFISLEQVLCAFRTAGRDYPKSLHVQRNSVTNQWEECG